MQQLKQEKVWAVCHSGGRGIRYLSTADYGEVAPTDIDRLVDFDTASLHFCKLSKSYPSPYAVALSLDAAKCIAIDLHAGIDQRTGLPCDEAYHWLQSLRSYSEKCWPSDLGQAIRVIARGVVPDGVTLPQRVQLHTQGFITLTGHTISPYPSWYQFINADAHYEGEIRDVSAELENLLRPHRPQYIEI